MKYLIMGLILITFYKYSSNIKNVLLSIKHFPLLLKSFKLIFKEKESLCAYCKHSIKIQGEYKCLEVAEYRIYPYDVVVVPKDCKEVNYNNKCQRFKFDWLWFVK